MEKNKIIYYAGIIVLFAALGLKIVSRFFRDELKSTGLMNNVFGIVFPIIGFIVIFAVYEQYDYFVDDPKYKFFQTILGKTGVKVFYYLVGLFLFYMGFRLMYI